QRGLAGFVELRIRRPETEVRERATQVHEPCPGEVEGRLGPRLGEVLRRQRAEEAVMPLGEPGLAIGREAAAGGAARLGGGGSGGGCRPGCVGGELAEGPVRAFTGVTLPVRG